MTAFPVSPTLAGEEPLYRVMKLTPSFVRSAVLAGLLGLAGTLAPVAQEVVAPASVEEVFGKLVQLQ
ncbi:MAG: hypothetical protein EON59_06660, partial [Alphaproteobacteria bacterium]